MERNGDAASIVVAIDVVRAASAVESKAVPDLRAEISSRAVVLRRGP